jgi:hypothetical protein
MKHLSARLFIIGGNLIGVLLIFAVLGGLLLADQLSISWISLISVVGICTLTLGGTNLFLCSRWILSPLSILQQLLDAPLSGTYKFEQPSSKLAELYALDQTIRTQQHELHSLLKASHAFWESGTLPKEATSLSNNELYAIAVRYMHTLAGMADYIDVLIDGHLYCDIPDTIAHTKFGQALRIMTPPFSGPVDTKRDIGLRRGCLKEYPVFPPVVVSAKKKVGPQ